MEAGPRWYLIHHHRSTAVMAQNIKGTFQGKNADTPSAISDVLVIPTGTTSARLNLRGGDAGVDTVLVQKSIDNGITWSTEDTLTTPQVNTTIAVAHGEQWRLQMSGTPDTDIDYSLSAES